MVIYSGTLKSGGEAQDAKQPDWGCENLENDTEKRSEQRQLILREFGCGAKAGTEETLRKPE